MVYPPDGVPQTPVSAVVDRHVAVGPGRYELVARLGGFRGTARSSDPSVRVRYTATWGGPVPVDAPSRVTLWSAPLDGSGGETAEARIDLPHEGLRASGIMGRALILRDERGALLAALFQGTVGRRGGSTAPPAPPPGAGTARGRALGATLVFRISSHTDYSEVSRSEDLCLVTREHRSVDMRLGGGPWRRIPVGGSLDVAPIASPRAATSGRSATPSATYRVIALDASMVTTHAATCRGHDEGKLSLVIVRRDAGQAP